jgi:hypothetical protein
MCVRSVFVCFLFSVAGVALGDTLANWQFDDGAPSSTATALVTEVNAPALNGTTNRYSASAQVPVFSSDRPGTRLWSSFTGSPINTTNTASLLFVNADLPGNTNSGNGGFVLVPDNALLHPSNITVEAFIKVNRRVNYPLVIGKERGSGNTSWNIDFDNAGHPRVRIDSGVAFTNGAPGWNQSWTATVNVEDGQWHHVAFTYTYTNRLVRLYIDYALNTSGNSFSNLVYDTGSLRIGQGAGGRAFDGWIDEIRISDNVLTPEQFMTVSAPTSTRGYWTFEDGTPGSSAGTLTNLYFAPFLYGTASTINGGTVKPAFSSDRPPATTDRISDGKNGATLNHNAGSLFFVNAGLPSNASSQSGGVVTVSGSVLPAAMTNFTAETFVKVNRHVGFPQIIGKTRSAGLSWSLALNSSGNLRARFDTHTLPDTTGNNQTFESSALIEDGKWHHVALTYDYPTKTVRLYRDYTKVLEGTTVNPMITDSGNFQIGAGDMAFDGWIDEVRLTDRVLAPTEFLYTVPLPGTIISLN